MKVLIVDDESLAREELSFLLKDNAKVAEVYEADSIDGAFRIINEFKIDLIFLDIQLGDENGFDLAEELKSKKNGPKIVFATAYDQYALDAFDVNAVDYVLKPFEKDRVDEAIDKVGAAETLLDAAKVENPRISITEEDRTAVILKNTIITACVESGGLMVNTSQRVYKTKLPLTKFLESLDPVQFMQVHRSYVVNLDFVASVEPSFNHTYELTMTDGSKVPVSRSFVSAMKDALAM